MNIFWRKSKILINSNMYILFSSEKDNPRINRLISAETLMRQSYNNKILLPYTLPIETQSPRRVCNSMAQFVIFLFGKINSFFIVQPC